MLDTTKPVQWKEDTQDGSWRWMQGNIVRTVRGNAVSDCGFHLVSYEDMGRKYEWVFADDLTNYPTAPIPEPTK